MDVGWLVLKKCHASDVLVGDPSLQRTGSTVPQLGVVALDVWFFQSLELLVKFLWKLYQLCVTNGWSLGKEALLTGEGLEASCKSSKHKSIFADSSSMLNAVTSKSLTTTAEPATQAESREG